MCWCTGVTVHQELCICSVWPIRFVTRSPSILKLHTVVSHIQLFATCVFIRAVLTFIAWLIELNAPAQLVAHAVAEQATEPIVSIATIDEMAQVDMKPSSVRDRSAPIIITSNLFQDSDFQWQF